MTLCTAINLVNQVLNYAVNLGVLSFNPCLQASKAYHKEPPKNHPAIHYSELPLLLADFEQSNREPLTKFLFRWQLLSMVRPAEAVSVEWNEIDLNKKIWVIPEEK